MKPNSQFLGPESKLYPFQNLTFDAFIQRYLPKLSQLKHNSQVKRLFTRGHYRNTIDAERAFFGQRLVLVDGGVLKERPWESLQKIEHVLFGRNNFFVRERFVKQNGNYCLLRKNGELLCMPSSKGRSAEKIISPQTNGSKFDLRLRPIIGF